MLLESVCSIVCDMVGDDSLWSRGERTSSRLSQLVFPKRSSAVAALPPACLQGLSSRLVAVLCHDGGGGSCIGVLRCFADAYYSAQNGTRSLIRSERKDRATSIYTSAYTKDVDLRCYDDIAQPLHVFNATSGDTRLSYAGV
jgi:hypothetical protein